MSHPTLYVVGTAHGGILRGEPTTDRAEAERAAAEYRKHGVATGHETATVVSYIPSDYAAGHMTAASEARVTDLEAALTTIAAFGPDVMPVARGEMYGEAATAFAADVEDFQIASIARNALSGGTSALEAHDAALIAEVRKKIAQEVESHAEDVDSMHWRQAHRIIAQRIVAGADVLATIRAKGGK